MTGKEICQRAASLHDVKYWWGAKIELATVALANRLMEENPTVWTSKYYNKAIQDIDGKTRVGDCSGLVCYAYDTAMISSYAIEAKYPVWMDSPKDGMILWRRGHVGIYEGGRVHELKSIDYDYRFDIYDASRWAKVLYDKAVDYDAPVYPLGWNRNMVSGKWWYQTGPGADDYYRNCVAQINGDYYAFGQDGYMVEGAAIIQTDTNGEIVSVDPM